MLFKQFSVRLIENQQNMLNFVTLFLLFSRLTELVTARNAYMGSSASYNHEENCDVDYQPNEIIDITSIEDEGRANFLGAKKAATDMECAKFCCDSFTPELPNSPQSCNTAVYFPDPDGKRDKSCFLLFCIDPYCGKNEEFIIKGKSYNSTFVIFLNDFHSPKSTTTTSTASSGNKNSEIDSNVPEQDSQQSEQEDQGSNPTEDQESENQLKSNESSVDESMPQANENSDSKILSDSVQSNETANLNEESQENDNQIESDVDSSMNTHQAKYSPTSDQVGTVLISLFVVLIVLTASVLIANKLYQQYHKRKLYDKLDYLSTEPLYGYGDRTDYD